MRHSIISTLAYFDLSDYPLTKEELFVWLWQPSDFASLRQGRPAIGYLDFLNAVANLSLDSKFGYYFFPGREKIVEERRRKLLISEQKLKIARRAARLIKSIPFLKAVFVCNTTGSEQANDGSDIDFFIVTEKNRIWITRLLVTFLLELFRLRRTNKRIKSKICLSFYVTADSLDLAKLRVAEDDVHFAYWINQMLPVFDPDNYYAKFLQANQWTNKYLPNIDAKSVSAYIFKIHESLVGKIWKKAWEKMWEGSYGDLIDSQAKKMQLSKMKFSGKKIDRGEDKGVVISDQVLKFHEKDTRIEYRDKWKKLCDVVCHAETSSG